MEPSKRTENRWHLPKASGNLARMPSWNVSSDSPLQLDSIRIFADGASSGNPGPSGWACVIAFPGTAGSEARVIEEGGFAERATNNQMELQAVIEALQLARQHYARFPLSKTPIEIATDSSYVIQGIQSWVPKWEKNGWLTLEGKPVANELIWKALRQLTLEFSASGILLKWIHVPGHQGIPGNERVDRLAVAQSRDESPSFYQGPLASYSVSLALPHPSASKEPKIQPFYLSLLDGKLERHPTWAECETRVRGRSGARYKKISSKSEEEQTLKGWGVRT